MFYFELFDKNKQLINRISTDNLRSVLVDSEPFEEVNLSYHHSLFENIDYGKNFGISVLLPIDGGEDFIFQYVSDAFLSFLDEVQKDKLYAKSYKNSFPLFVKLGLLDYYKESYQLNKLFKGTFKIYDEELLLFSFNFKIFSESDHLYIFSNDVTELDVVESEFNSLFEYSTEGVLLVDKTGKILKMNPAFSKITGYSFDELDDLEKCFEVIDEINDEKADPNSYLKVFNDLLSYKILSKESKMKIIHNDGTYKWIKTYSIKSRFDGFIRINCSDITETVLIEEELKRLKFNYDIVQSMGEIVIIDRRNGLFNWSYEFYNIFGKKLPKKQYSTYDDLIYKYLLNGNENFLKKITMASENKEIFTSVFPFKTDGDVKYFKIWANFQYPEFSYDNSFVGFIQDISSEIRDKLQLGSKLIENDSLFAELNQSLKDKEQLINEKDQLLYDKSILLKEVHHRVKNNLQIILSMLKIDSKRGEDPENLLKLAINQINAISLIHEKIYLSSDLAHVNIKEYISSAIDSLFDLYSVKNINLNYDLDDIELNLDTVTPIGLILNELVNNTIKYAFPNDDEGNLFVSVKSKDDKIILTFGDDGIGLPEDLDLLNSDSIGFIVIKNLVSQINGEIAILNEIGTVYEIKFPLSNSLVL